MATASNIRIRLPGVYFLPPPRAEGLGLPPLDVAAFVGFAERGPLHTPVAVEDLNAYRAIFGGDLELARDVGGRTVYAHLPAAVSSFFSNGGRRCYVVRVAGRRATQTRLRVPGMVALAGSQTGAGLPPESAPRLVSVRASSEGRWSERLRLGARLRATPLPAAAFSEIGPNRLSWETGSAPDAVREGDLLRLTFNDGRQWLFPVAAVEQLSAATAAANERRLRLTARQVWRSGAPPEASPPPVVVKAHRLTAGGADFLQVGGTLSAGKRTFELALSGPQAGEVKRGDVLRLSLSDNSTYLFPATEVSNSGATASPPGPQLVARAGSILKLPAEPLPLSSPPSLRRVERLRFDLLLRDGKERRPTLGELAFNAGHDRFWGAVSLLESSSLYRQAAADADAEGARQSARLFRELKEEKRSRELPDGGLNAIALAGLLAPADEPSLTYLPLDMPAILDEEDLLGPAAEAVGQDDLETFDPGLFVDPYLVPNVRGRSASADALMKEAFDRYYAQDRRLRGLHSLTFIDEVALLAVPDAVHREWKRAITPVVSPPFSSPDITSPPPAPDHSLFADCDAKEPARPDAAQRPTPTAQRLPVLTLLEDFNPEHLIQIQRAALNLCQARRDVLCVLTLPRHFEKRQCVEWLEDFRGQLGLPARRSPSGDAGDTSDLSYAAVYHPWLLAPDENEPDNLRAVPGDGAVCGVIAARERERQVWVAPANVPLKGVLGLTPKFDTEEWADLFDLQFNLIRSEPRDFRAMSAHTLSDENIWLQVSVRRLLILLRKLAVERGLDFVFESNDTHFREAVRLMLEEILRFMFERGAFSGATPEQAYRVVVDKSVNTPESVDAGRFIAQIQVAPSQPTEFITVLLSRIGEDLLQAAEA